MSMKSISITGKCNCDKSNWVKYKTNSRILNKSVLVHCNKCNSQWYSKAKYTEELLYANKNTTNHDKKG